MSGKSGPSLGASTRGVDRLLRLYPAEYRKRFGDGMRRMLGEELAHARARGRIATILFWMRSVRDAAIIAVTEVGLFAAESAPALASRGLEGSIQLIRPPAQPWSIGMDTLIQDVRYGIRQLARQRGSSIVAVLTLGLGIGASAAIFSVIDATILRPVPYPDPEQLVTVGVEIPMPEGRTSQPTTSMADVRRWQEAGDVFASVAGSGSAFGGRIVEGPEPERIQVSHFTEDYLSMHGVSPLIGRGFTREDTEFGAPGVALLGYNYWRSRYGAREDVIGETIALDDGVSEIVGVLPASFNADVPLARPLQVSPELFDRRGTGRVSVYARLRPDVSVEAARERLSARMAGEPLPEGAVGPVRVRVTSRLETALSRYRTTVNVMAGAVALIVLLACVNVAGLLLARGAARQSEVAVRASLGAGRMRLVRQLFTESLVLALAGGGVGVLLAWLSLDAIVANVPLSLPADSPITLNLKVLGATAALLVPTALLFGVAPAIRLSRAKSGSLLGSGGRRLGSSLTRRGGQLLIASEVALAAVLVAGAGVMLQSFARLSAVDLGFDEEGLITMQVLPLDEDAAVREAYYVDVVQRLRALNGVESVGVVDNFVLGGRTSYTSVQGDGEPIFAAVFRMSPGYMETLRATLRSGRLPTEADHASGLRGVVLNEAAASQMFGGAPAAGRQITGGGPGEGEPWTVLGVVADLRHGGPLDDRSQDFPQVFYPLRGGPGDQAMTVVLRPSQRIPALANLLRETAQGVGPRVLVENVRTAEELWGDRVRTPRRRTVMLGLLGGLGLAVALIGVIGVTSYAVARRAPEIGVRVAFGARPGQVVGAMLRDSVVPIVIGTAMGLGAASLATRVIASFLYETEPVEAGTFAAVALTLAVTGCVAALLPSLRAARIDPVGMLRTE